MQASGVLDGAANVGIESTSMNPLGTPPLSAKKVSENLEKVPRI